MTLRARAKKQSYLLSTLLNAYLESFDAINKYANMCGARLSFHMWKSLREKLYA